MTAAPVHLGRRTLGGVYLGRRSLGGAHLAPTGAGWRSVALAATCALVLACGSEPPPEPPALPSSAMPHAVRLALDETFSCALTRERRVWCWGEIAAEVVDVPLADRIHAPRELVSLRGAIEIAASATTLCARTADHRVLCWGEDAETVPGTGGPAAVIGLEGTRSLAVGEGRVCAIAGETLRCVAQNRAPDVGAVPAGATLRSIGGVICALDGTGPALCMGPGDRALRPVAGSEGAIAIAVADGVCAATSAGELRCQASAGAITDAALEPVTGAPPVRWVAGTTAVRCVAAPGAEGEMGAVSCARSEPTHVGPRASTLGGRVLALAAADDGASGWHVCAIARGPSAADEEIRCWGTNRVGEIGRPAPARGSVARVEHAPLAREVAVVGSDVVIVDDRGRLRAHAQRGAEAGAPVEALGAVSGLAAVWNAGCGIAQDGALACVWPESDEHRRVEGFHGRGRVLAVSGLACAATDDDHVACVDHGPDAVPFVIAARLARPVAFGGLVCGLRGASVACESPFAWHRPGPRRPPLGGAGPRALPARLARLFAGAEQLFAVSEDGAARALGHNGVGQLGLAPSRPLESPTAAVLPADTTAMAFAHHVSCAYGETSGISCAGLDETLSPREPSLSPLDFLAGGVVDRGDGTWTPIPDVGGARSVSIGDRGFACAVDPEGALWCWGAWPRDTARGSADEPSPVRLGGEPL